MPRWIEGQGWEDGRDRLGLRVILFHSSIKIAAKRSPQTPRPASPPYRRARHIAVPR